MDEAYFFAARLFRRTEPYVRITETIQKKGMVYLGSDPSMQVYMYLNETPSTIPTYRTTVHITKEKLVFQYEIRSRMKQKLVMLPPRVKSPRLYPRLLCK